MGIGDRWREVLLSLLNRQKINKRECRTSTVAAKEKIYWSMYFEQQMSPCPHIRDERMTSFSATYKGVMRQIRQHTTCNSAKLCMLIFAETVLIEHKKKKVQELETVRGGKKVQITGPTSHQIQYYRTRSLAHFILPDLRDPLHISFLPDLTRPLYRGHETIFCLNNNQPSVLPVERHGRLT